MARISKRTAKRKPRGKPFPKGVSGNPNGRPPLTPTEKEFRELCKLKSPEAIKRIESRAKRGKGMTAQRADEYIVDRGYGKPKQEMAVSPGGGGGGLIICLPPENPDA